MIHKRRRRAAAAVFAALLPLGGLLLVAGCSRSTDTAATPAGPGAGGPAPGRGGQVVAAGATGAQIYQMKCQGCHGIQGQGARGPALTRAAGRPVADVSRIIHDGHGRMPAFAGQLTDAQITTVAAYVKSFGPAK